MLFKEIKTWGNKLGYKVVKENKDPIEYSWTKLGSDDPNASGVAPSVSKLARAIFNHITDNKWSDYQQEYKEKLEKTDAHISSSNYG